MVIPIGDQKFQKSLERWKAAREGEERKDARTQCCMLCPKNIDCEECLIGSEEEYNDSFAKGVPGGIHSTTIFQDKNGEYHYSHPYGGG